MSPSRLAGLLYFSTHLTSIGAVVAYGGLGAGLLQRSSDQLVLGAGLEVLLALGCAGTGIVLLPLLRSRAETGALAFFALRLVEAAIIAGGACALVAMDRIADDRAALAALHDASFLVGQGLIIAVNTVVIGTVLARTGAVPRWIGVIGVVAGSLLLISNTGQLTGGLATGGTVAGLMAIPAFVFEISFASYLVGWGVRE